MALFSKCNINLRVKSVKTGFTFSITVTVRMPVFWLLVSPHDTLRFIDGFVLSSRVVLLFSFISQLSENIYKLIAVIVSQPRQSNVDCVCSFIVDEISNRSYK